MFWDEFKKDIYSGGRALYVTVYVTPSAASSFSFTHAWAWHGGTRDLDLGPQGKEATTENALTEAR